MEHISINGKYKLNITFQTMFNTYNATFQHHNLITDKGLEFLVKKWAKDHTVTDNIRETYNITKIIVGTNPEKPSKDDALDTFNKVEHSQNPFNINVHSDGSSLKMSSNNISGAILNGTTEIGVIGEHMEEELSELDGSSVNLKLVETVLISRDSHPVMTVPVSSIISLEYIYELTSITTDDCE